MWALHDWCVGEMVRSHRGRSGSDIRLDAGLNGRAIGSASESGIVKHLRGMESARAVSEGMSRQP